VTGGSSGAPTGGPIVVATANADKAREISAVLEQAGLTNELRTRPRDVGPVEETGTTLEANARLKAEALRDATGCMALADDTGLEVDALGGAPGVRTGRYAGEDATYADNVRKLLAELRVHTRASRTARFRTVVVLARPDGSEVVAAGKVEGVIADEPRGDGGFGYDPVFVPAGGGGRTFAEMSPAAKAAISHRGRALRAVAALLREAAVTGQGE
jgi:XTP/dITP diphosphohydrolase